MYGENCECKKAGVERPPETVFNLLGESYDLTTKALAMAMKINATLFGKQAKEQKQENPLRRKNARSRK